MRNWSGVISHLAATVTFAVLEICAVVMIVNNGTIQKMRVVCAVRDAQAFVWSNIESLREYAGYKTANQRLREENLSLKQQLEVYRSFVEDNDILLSEPDPQFGFITAKVVKNSVGKQHNYLVVNKGQEDGVESGMGVITEKGVVGIVGAVGRRYSYINSFLNEGQSVSAKLTHGNTFGIMEWSGKNPREAILREIPAHVETSPGDTVATSGFSTLFPPDIPLGRVVSSNTLKGISQEITLELFEEFRSLGNVYIVDSRRIKEIKKLEDEQ